MNGIVEYQSPINNDPLYKLINFENGTLYAVEVASLSGNKLADAGWVPGDMCCALFALTEDEYMLKDGNVAALNEFVSKLYNNIPEDRLVNAYYQNMNGEQREMRPRPGCETMDDHKYAKYRDSKLGVNVGIPYLKAAERVYVAYHSALGAAFPTIDMQGNAWVFTKEEYAKDIEQKNAGAGICYKEYSNAEFMEFVSSWKAMGITKFVLNVATEDHNCVIQLDDFLPEYKETVYFQSELNGLMIRFLQNRANTSLEGNMKFSQLLWSLIAQRLPNTVFLVPIEYENDDFSDLPDYNIHIHPASVEPFNRMSLGAYTDDAVGQNCKIEFENGPKLLVGKIKFFGGEKYEVGGATVARTMHLRTLINPSQGKSFLPVFTDIRLIKRLYGEKIRVALWTYEELAKRSGDFSTDFNRPLDGLVINPGGACIELNHDAIASIAKINNSAETAQDDERKMKITKMEKLTEPPKKGKKAALLVTIILAIAVIIGAIVLAVGMSGSEDEEKDTGKEAAPVVVQKPVEKDEKKESKEPEPTVSVEDETQKKIDEFLAEIDTDAKIDGIYVACEDGEFESPSVFEGLVHVTATEEKVTDSYVYIETKAEILEWLKRAELKGCKRVICLIRSIEPGTIRGASYDLSEVMEGYLNDTWTFNNAEKDFEKQHND